MSGNTQVGFHEHAAGAVHGNSQPNGAKGEAANARWPHKITGSRKKSFRHPPQNRSPAQRGDHVGCANLYPQPFLVALPPCEKDLRNRLPARVDRLRSTRCAVCARIDIPKTRGSWRGCANFGQRPRRVSTPVGPPPDDNKLEQRIVRRVGCLANWCSCRSAKFRRPKRTRRPDFQRVLRSSSGRAPVAPHSS